MNHNHEDMSDMGSQNMVGMDMDMNDTSGCDSMGMMMYFHIGKCEYVLFKSLYTTTNGAMVGACIVIFVLAILYEGMKVFREHLQQQAMLCSMPSSITNGSSSQETMVIGNRNVGIHMMSCSHFIQTLLHMLQVFISYCLMLVFMTYNAWLCLSVILGAGAGYFLFGWRKAIVVDINEHCH